MSEHSVCIWTTGDIFGGDSQKILEQAKKFHSTHILLKIGNGLSAWTGLESIIREAHAQGLEVWGWWYMYGRVGEASLAGRHAALLGVDVLVLDVEGHWELNTDRSVARANKDMADIKASFHGRLALCSWWKPSYHKTPVKAFLAHCDYNMPQMYWMGRDTAVGAVNLIAESLREYQALGWSPSKTIPVLAAFGQTYVVGGTKLWWETTVMQMDVAQEACKRHGVMGISWWSFNYIVGGAGNPSRTAEIAMIQAIESFKWGTAGNVQPVPGPTIPPIEEGYRRLWERAIKEWPDL